MSFLGQHTASELADLLKAKDGDLASLEKAYRAFDAQWMREDKNADDAWLTDYNALKARYAKARADAAATVSADDVWDPLPNNVIMVQSEYDAVVRSLQATEGVTAPGDFQGLWSRLQNAQNASLAKKGMPPRKLPEAPVAQPRSEDADLALYTLFQGGAQASSGPPAGSLSAADLARALGQRPPSPSPPPNATNGWDVVGAVAGVLAVVITYLQLRQGSRAMGEGTPRSERAPRTARAGADPGPALFEEHESVPVPPTERSPATLRQGPASVIRGLRTAPTRLHETIDDRDPHTLRGL